MAKQSGLPSSLLVGVYDLSGDIGSISKIDSTRAVLDVTGIDKSAPERIMGRKDGSLTWLAFWNTTPGQAHAVLSALATTDVQVSYLSGASVGAAAASMIARQLNYGANLGADGSLTAAVNADADGYGLEWGELLTTGKQTFATGTVNGTSIDLGAASTLFGAAAYLHVISVASGTATFTVQDSADDITYATVTGMAFAGATGATTERVQGAVNATVRRYVRIQGTGVHGNAVVVVNFVRYLETP